MDAWGKELQVAVKMLFTVHRQVVFLLCLLPVLYTLFFGGLFYKNALTMVPVVVCNLDVGDKGQELVRDLADTPELNITLVNGDADTDKLLAATNAAGTYGATDENGNVAIGGTVGIEHVDSQGILAVGRKASIEAPVMTILTSNNAINVENKVKNAGKGEKVGISGMWALSYGDANSLLSWDDEASLQSGNLTALSSNSVSGDTSARTENSSQYAFGLGVGISNFTVNTLAIQAAR